MKHTTSRYFYGKWLYIGNAHAWKTLKTCTVGWDYLRSDYPHFGFNDAVKQINKSHDKSFISSSLLWWWHWCAKEWMAHEISITRCEWCVEKNYSVKITRVR